MKFLLVTLVSLCSLACYAEGAHISGATSVNPGQTETYSVTWDNWGTAYVNFANVSFSVTNGTVISNTQTSVTIQWDGSASIFGNIYVYEDLGGQDGSLDVTVQATGTPTLFPLAQTVSYGTTPFALGISFDAVPSSVSYQWQEWSPLTASWTDLPGETSDTYQPQAATVPKNYRCVVVVNGSDFYLLNASVTVSALNPGLLSISVMPSYNGTASVTATNATGGFCLSSSYAYSWEVSYDNGPWSQLGTSATPPFIQVTGHVLLRRKVTCGSESLYTNILDISPSYTSVDFENRNYVREITVTKKGISSWEQADQLTTGDKLQTTDYLDGFGRNIQTVMKEQSVTGSNTWNDLVSHFEYGINDSKNFLPYSASTNIGKFKTTAAADQQAYVHSFFNEPAGSPTYTQTIYEKTPMSRTVKQWKAGAGWNNSAITYDANGDNEKVHIWDLDYTSNAIPVTSSSYTYPAGSLIKITSYDEKGNKRITYADKEGRTILKKVQALVTGLTAEHAGWICTYYVYDDFGQQRYIITPKAVEWLDNHGWNLSQTIIDQLCFSYGYDERGRVIIKKQPGADAVYLVYDKKDRIVLSQNANQRKISNAVLANDQWSFVLYNGLSQKIATGLVENNNSLSLLQSSVDQLGAGTATISAFAGNATYYSIVADMPVVGSSGSSNYLSGNGNVIFNSITFYGDYGYANAKAFTSSFTFSNNNDPAADPVVKTDRVSDLPTGTLIRVLDNDNSASNDKFLLSTLYYDEKSRGIEALSDNHKGGVTYRATQYDFGGKVLSAYENHYINGGGAYTITSKNVYDRIGRLKELYKSFNGSAAKELAEYNYDELGESKSKRLGPTGASSQMEIQDFTYNSNGYLTGINKTHALGNNNYTQWDRYFSEYLGYNNSDGVFAGPEYNGSITGAIWRTQGDNTPRKYDYEYDLSDKLIAASFKQRKTPATSGWSNSDVDLSVSLEYEDGNGNIKSMKQLGIVPGTAGGLAVDDLRYSYVDIAGVTGLKSNQLKQVDDLGVLGANNGKLGDFNDQNSTQDYFYDKNGNLVKDLNKNFQDAGGASGITYNYLNKATKIVNFGKSQIDYVYDAGGVKLSETVTQLPTVANGNHTTVTTTDYLNGFIYSSVSTAPALSPNTDYTNRLDFILHEEGRLKIIAPVNGSDRVLTAGADGVIFSSGQHGTFEYFVKDHLGSTRMLLTEEVQKESYWATMEQSAASLEEPLFGKVPASGVPDQTNELRKTRYSNSSNPSATPWPNNATDIVELTAAQAGRQIGPNMLLKVMAGDLITSTSKYYYLNNSSSGGSGDPTGQVVSSLIDALLSPDKGSGIGKTYNNPVKTQLTADMNNFITGTEPAGGSVTSAPKAYLNIVFLDEQFNFIDKDISNPGVGTDFIRVSSNNDGNAVLAIINQKAPKNGWVFVYLSNESNEPVYFDDFKVAQEHGRIAEETHYYPFGLKIAGISSRAFNKLENKYNFQADFSESDDETGWNEFALRNYDPQLGRWTAADPKDQYASPYTGMGNDPVNNTDADGGEASAPPDWYEGPNGAIINKPGVHDATLCIDGIEYHNIGDTWTQYAVSELPGNSFQYVRYVLGTWKSVDDGPAVFTLNPDARKYTDQITPVVKKTDGGGFWETVIAMGRADASPELVAKRELIQETLLGATEIGPELKYLNEAIAIYKLSKTLPMGPPIPNAKDLPWEKGKSPGGDWVWKGNGAAETGRGNWVNQKTGQKLHPDLDHPEPKGPHWGLQQPNGEKFDIYKDGKVEPNNK